MKKWIIAVGIAVVLAIAVVAVVFLSGSEANADEEYYIPPLREGKYYLDGNVESGVYLNLEGGKISLNGDRDALFDLMAESAEKSWDEEFCGRPWTLDDSMISSINEYLDFLCEERVYHQTPAYGELLGLEEKKYMVMYSYSEPDEHGFCGGMGYEYDGDDTLSGFCDFVYVENA